MAGPSALWEALQALLPRTKEELKLELGEKVEGSVVMLLQEAAELFHGGQRRECLQTCEVLLDYSWEKLNTGPWQHVDKDWRRVYAFGCLLKAVCLCEPPGDAASVAAALKACDMGLLMGAAILGDILLKVAAVLQKHLLSGKRPAPGPSQELLGTKAWGRGRGGGASGGAGQPVATPNKKSVSPIFLEVRGQLSPGGKPPGVLTPVEKWHLHQFGNRATSLLNFFFFSACAKAMLLGESGRVGALWLLRKRTQRVGVAKPHFQQEPVSFNFFLAPWWKCHQLFWLPLSLWPSLRCYNLCD